MPLRFFTRPEEQHRVWNGKYLNFVFLVPNAEEKQAAAHRIFGMTSGFIIEILLNGTQDLFGSDAVELSFKERHGVSSWFFYAHRALQAIKSAA